MDGLPPRVSGRRMGFPIGALLLIGLGPIPAVSSVQAIPRPVEVQATLDINEVFEIDNRRGTFGLNAYLEADWIDPDPIPQDECPRTYADDEVGGFLTDRWRPAFELIGVVDHRSISQTQIDVDCDGRVHYVERFNATLTADLELNRFPFDEQRLLIQVESFLHSIGDMTFGTTEVETQLLHAGRLLEWDLLEARSRVVEQRYRSPEELSQSPPGTGIFSRWEVELRVRRRSGYYLWHFMVPLSLIIAASWTSFWLPKFEHQLGNALRLFLTLIAFSFTTSHLLPRLPYMTFINTMVVAGHLAIFAQAALLCLAHGLCITGHRDLGRRFLAICRWAVPLACLLMAALLTRSILGD